MPGDMGLNDLLCRRRLEIQIIRCIQLRVEPRDLPETIVTVMSLTLSLDTVGSRRNLETIESSAFPSAWMVVNM